MRYQEGRVEFMFPAGGWGFLHAEYNEMKWPWEEIICFRNTTVQISSQLKWLQPIVRNISCCHTLSICHRHIVFAPVLLLQMPFFVVLWVLIFLNQLRLKISQINWWCRKLRISYPQYLLMPCKCLGFLQQGWYFITFSVYVTIDQHLLFAG